MKKILVACSMGVTTSLLVSKMRTQAEGYAVDVDIQAVPLSEAIEQLATADAVLLGPQVAFAKAQIEEASPIPVLVIDAEQFARADAAGILANVLKEIAE